MCFVVWWVLFEYGSFDSVLLLAMHPGSTFEETSGFHGPVLQILPPLLPFVYYLLLSMQ